MTRSIYYPANLTIGLLFLFLNPLYALPFSALISIAAKNRINNLWVGLLYSISFAMMFFTQNYSSQPDSDIKNYVSIYEGIDRVSYTFLWDKYINSFLHNEFFWYAYTKTISFLSNNNTSLFVFITYLTMFALSAYLAYSVSMNGKYNFVLLLFYLIYFNMAFQYGTYLLWRNTLASLLFLIGMVKIKRGSSNIFPRIIMYSAVLFHTTMIPLIMTFEIFNFFVNNNSYFIQYRKKLLRGLFYLLLFVIALLINQDDIIYLFFNISSLKPAFLEYTLMHSNIDYRYFLAPLPILFTTYIILNRKNILFYELYLFLLYFALVISPIFITGIPASVVGRMLLGLWIILSLTACKLIARSNYIGLLFFVIIFIYRLETLSDPNILHELTYVGKGNYLNLFYGPYSMLLFYESPVFW